MGRATREMLPQQNPDGLDALEDHLVDALSILETQTDVIKSVVAWDWIINAAFIDNKNWPRFHCLRSLALARHYR
jgi:hypothetical protein